MNCKRRGYCDSYIRILVKGDLIVIIDSEGDNCVRGIRQTTGRGRLHSIV